MSGDLGAAPPRFKDAPIQTEGLPPTKVPKVRKVIFLNKYNDYTNAFKIYKKKTLLNLFPLISENFNIFLELPLKIISRKYTYKIIPISWKGRKDGYSKFDLKEL